MPAVTHPEQQPTRSSRTLPAPFLKATDLMQNEQQERENADLLAAMMGEDMDPEVARRVLRKCNGDLQKAATAILEGDRGEDALWPLPPPTRSSKPQYNMRSEYEDSSPTSSIQQVTPADPSGVIDLTSDDDELSRALHLSMESQTETKFGPSNRAPDPAWAVVPSNVETNAGMSQDEQTLSRAIEASYNDFAPEESDTFPLEETVREGGRPVALRPDVPTIAYAALVVQGLFFVPQVRASLARLHLPTIDERIPPNSPSYAIWRLVEIFVNMDLCQLSALVCDEVFVCLEAPPWNSPGDAPGELSSELVKKVAQLIEHHLRMQTVDEDPVPRLFNFRHGRIEVQGSASTSVPSGSSETCVVTVEIGGGQTVANDLISRLSANLSHFHDAVSNHDVIFEPSQVVAFHLKHQRAPSSPQNPAPDGFIYPKSIYLDQFLSDNLELANQKRSQQREMHAEIHKLTRQKQALTHFNDKDTLKDLRASIHYFEHVAVAKDGTERRLAVDRAAAKLNSILAAIENEVEAIDQRIAKLTKDSAVLFDCPELQQQRYDLRVVLLHTGIPGRKQIYSYVQDKGTWWKTVDFTVTEVPEETVLTDPVGMHLGAGPYMLIYSRSLPNDDGSTNALLSWPKHFEDGVLNNNAKFLASLPSELAAKAAPLQKPEMHILTEVNQVQVREDSAMDVGGS